MPASQPAYFHLQEFSDLGAPLVGGRLYTYAQGTTAFKVAYTDIDGEVPQTYTADGLGGQYIALNARGELPGSLYLGAGSYDIALKRANGSTVWTRRADPVRDDGQRPMQTEGQVAADGQRTFTLQRLTYTPGIGSLKVYVDGFRVTMPDYVETASNKVTFARGLGAGQEVLFEIGSGINSQTAIDAALIPYSPSIGHTTNVAAKLDQFIDAADEGFSVAASATANRDAVLAAVTRANGREVRVIATSDFQMAEVIITDMPVNLVFIGGGRVDKSGGSIGLMQVNASYTDIQNITAIARVTYVTDGNASGVATRVTVANSSAYQRGDVVRVVSDDIEVQADTSVPRRMGESAVVIGAAAGLIYLSTDLEDLAGYVTNPRIARLPQRQYSVKGLRCLSNLSHTGQLIGLAALYKPYIEFEVESHGQIGINSDGSYLGEFHVRGSGKGTSSGSLGYLVNDVSGFGNVFIRPHGKYWRHITTTNHNDTTLNDTRIHRYGGCRNHTVIGGIAESCQGTPWDEHEGARRTKWIDCTALSHIRNTSTAPCAFQVRGANADIINPNVDKSFGAVVRPGPAFIGTLRIIGGRSAGHMFDSTGSAGIVIRVINHEGIAENTNEVFGAVACDVYITGGRYSITKLTSNFATFINALPGARYFLDGPEFYLARHPTTPGTSFRFMSSEAGAGVVSIAGRCKFSSDGTATGINYFFRSDNSDTKLQVKAMWTGGVMPAAITSGIFATSKYAISDFVTPANSVTNVTVLDDYIKTLGIL